MAEQNTTTPPVHSRRPSGVPLYEKACPDCGKISVVEKYRLHKRCHPCAMKARSTHGLAARGSMHPLYRKLQGIRARCEHPSATNYAYYGGRGVSVCEEWRTDPASFVRWATESGWRPGLELDRIDPDGDYCPTNCRFISHRANSQRTRRIKTTHAQAQQIRRLLEEGRTVKEAAQEAGTHYMVAWHIKNSGTWAAS